jgi:hypothetical protein
MTDAVIGTLDYIGDFGYMVNSVLDSSDIDDCSTGLQTSSEIGRGMKPITSQLVSILLGAVSMQ